MSKKISGPKPVPVRIVSPGSPLPGIPEKKITRQTTTDQILKEQQVKEIRVYGDLVIDPKTKAAHFERDRWDDKTGKRIVQKIPMTVGKK